MTLTLEHAIARGVKRILVVGSAGGLHDHLPLGSIVVVDEVDAIGRQDGTSHHYVPAGQPVHADPEITEMLVNAAAGRHGTPWRGRAWTTDAPYRECEDGIRRQRAAGALVVEMEAAALFAVAQIRGIRAGLIFATSDEVSDEWHPGFSDAAHLQTLVQAADATMDVAATLAKDEAGG